MADNSKSGIYKGSMLAIAKDGVKQNGDVWEITLAQPLKKNIAEGTKVREHINGATFIWNAGAAKVQNKWINRAGVLNGQVMPGKPVVGHKLWPGTQSVRIIIRVTGKADSVTELRNIKIEELFKMKKEGLKVIVCVKE